MKTLSEIQKTLESFEKTYGVSVSGAQQGHPVWFIMKLGVLSASSASKIVAKKDSETRLTYMSELVAQVCTGLIEEIGSKATEWGHQNEDAARSSYEFATGLAMTRLCFVFKDGTFREGCSPDGIVSATKGAEIKCPYNTVHYIKFLAEEKLKPEYQWQNQFTMRVMDAGEWDACQFDPRMRKSPLKYMTVPRDPEMQKVLDDKVPEFIHDMDKMLAKIGVRFGDQWIRNPLISSAIQSRKESAS